MEYQKGLRLQRFWLGEKVRDVDVTSAAIAAGTGSDVDGFDDPTEEQLPDQLLRALGTLTEHVDSMIEEARRAAMTQPKLGLRPMNFWYGILLRKANGGSSGWITVRKRVHVL